MRRCNFSQVRGDVITSHQFSVVFPGLVDNCQSIAKSGRRQQRLRSADISALAFREHTLDSEKGVSRLRNLEYGTACPRHCDSLTLNSDNIKRLLKTFLYSETAAH